MSNSGLGDDSTRGGGASLEPFVELGRGVEDIATSAGRIYRREKFGL